MILRILFFVCAFIVYPSLGMLDTTSFSEIFEDNCFRNEESDEFFVNGQKTPLSNTLENFIAMAEKFEAANPSYNLKDELAFFIEGYVLENFEITRGKFIQWEIKRGKLDRIYNMWDPAQNGYKRDRSDLNNPFSVAENCSLYHMISHSLMKKDTELQVSKEYSPMNNSYSSRRSYSANLNIDDYYPQEIGVVAIRRTDVAVSLSKVLIGLYVGLKEPAERTKDLSGFENLNLDKFVEMMPQDTQVDALYAVTLAEVLMLSNWTGSARTGLAPNGEWVSIPLGQDKVITGFCPMVYKQQSTTEALPTYSFSSVRGAADGLILGLSILPIYKKKQDVKLSQILRMYYSPDGLLLESKAEVLEADYVSFCQRQSLIQRAESKLEDQMKSYGILVSNVPKDVPDIFKNTMRLYGEARNRIYENTNLDIRHYCDRPAKAENPEELPKETLLDVIVVLDSSITNSFQDQQLIVGHLAKELDLRYSGSTMTILLDQKSSSGSGSSSRIELKPVVTDTYSSACAACRVGLFGQIEDDSTEEPQSVKLDKEEVIVAIDQLLDEKKENDTNKNGVNGKVVLYFNYESENGRNGNNKIQGKLEKALRNLHGRHLDVLFYAVGLDPELLKKYAKNDPNLVFLGTDGTPEQVAKKIFDKLSYAPTLLQYSDCKEATNENAAVYENFVSPLTIQHYVMPAEYFYKSFKLSVNFESKNGYIKVCHNRGTPRPENEDKFCKNTTSTTGVEFKLSNPCKSFTKESCRPFYFSIMGMNTITEMRQNNREKDLCTDIKDPSKSDHWCSNLHQIKYKITHSGIRCSGCLGLHAPPAVVLIAILLSYITLKQL